MNIQDFKKAYVEELQKDKENYLFGESYETVIQIVDRMTFYVATQGKKDWLKHNANMKRAAKRFGIRKSKELREILSKDLLIEGVK